MKLYCKQCNYPISSVDLQRIAGNLAKLTDGVELIAEGFYVVASEIEILFGPKIDFLVNTKSVDLKNHNDSRRLAGCCGPGDLSVLNQVCPRCSAEIGVIIEDCWLPHFTGISAEKISEKPLW